MQFLSGIQLQLAPIYAVMPLNLIFNGHISFHCGKQTLDDIYQMIAIFLIFLSHFHISVRYATILAFDVKVERDAQELADSLGVKIFQADIIYHLFDKFTAYREELKQKKRDEFKSIAVFPCKLKVHNNDSYIIIYHFRTIRNDRFDRCL